MRLSVFTLLFSLVAAFHTVIPTQAEAADVGLSRMMRTWWGGLFFPVAGVSMASAAAAAPIPAPAPSPEDCFDGACIVTDGRALIGFDAGVTSSENDLDLFVVDGINHIDPEREEGARQQYYLRAGSDTIPPTIINVALSLSSATADENSNTIEIVFSEAGLATVTLEYTLTDNGTTVIMDETVTVENTGLSTITGSLFEYADWDPENTDDNDTASFDNTEEFDAVTYIDDDTATSITIYSMTPVSFFDVHDCCAQNILDARLINGNLAENIAFGLGDPAHALQYNQSIPSGGSTTIIRQTVFVPEPGAILQLVAGGIGLAFLDKRRMRKNWRAKGHQQPD